MNTLYVKDMTCGHCKARVMQVLKSVDPAAKVEIDLATKAVHVESACPLPELTQAVAEAGYPAKAE